MTWSETLSIWVIFCYPKMIRSVDTFLVITQFGSDIAMQIHTAQYKDSISI